MKNDQQKTPKKYTMVSLTIEPEVKAGIEELARGDERSLSNYVNRILKAHIAFVQNEQSQEKEAA
jgi:hypothetical protein